MNIMLDLETLGVKPGCKILSIGAVAFTIDKIHSKFYKTIDITSQDGLEIDPQTLLWWMNQSEGVRNEAFGGRMTMRDVLIGAGVGFSAFIQNLPPLHGVWGNGAGFDNSILRYAYEKFGWTVPWSHRIDRCYRTMKNLYADVCVHEPTVPHHALYDAQAQTLNMIEIFKLINK